MARTMTFKNTIYIFEKEIDLPISVGYVPSNDMLYAVKESLQNALDESLISGGKVSMTVEDHGVYLRDAGRGCDWEEILLIGDSGKRGIKGTTGEHGEGEVISFLVAAREGINKVMASRNWLLRGILKRNDRGKLVLVLELWKTRHGRNRKGTRWVYSSDNADKVHRIQSSFKLAKKAFANHAAISKNPQRVFASPSSSLMTNGLFVCTEYQLTLGYNLTSTPGRDRTSYSISDPEVTEEVRKLFETQATDEHIALVISIGLYGTSKKEFEFQGARMSPDLIRRAVNIVKRQRGKSNIVWANTRADAAMIADAQETVGDVGILLFPSNIAPLWVTQNIPHISAVVKVLNSRAIETRKTMAKDFKEAVWLLIDDVCGARVYVKRIEMHNPLSASNNARAAACGSTHAIKFDWKSSRDVTIESLFETVAHELAHLISGADDCTRGHTSAMGRIMAKAGNRLAVNAATRKAWRMAKTRIDRYTGMGRKE